MLFSVQPVGFEGERKAVALLLLAFYLAFYGLMALLTANGDQPELRAWWPLFAALALCYGTGFFALGAGWFWARWFAVGLGYSGLTTAAWGIVLNRSIEPVLVFYGLTHGLVALVLQGERLVAQFDAQPGWRERFKLDEAAVLRVRQTVTRAAAGLPTLIMFALMPRQPAYAMLLLLLTTAGLYGVLGLRTWGVLALGGAGLAALGLSAHTTAAYPLASEHAVQGLGLCGALLLLLAAGPFARPMVRFLRS